MQLCTFKCEKHVETLTLDVTSLQNQYKNLAMLIIFENSVMCVLKRKHAKIHNICAFEAYCDYAL